MEQILKAKVKNIEYCRFPKKKNAVVRLTDGQSTLFQLETGVDTPKAGILVYKYVTGSELIILLHQRSSSWLSRSECRYRVCVVRAPNMY